VLRDHDRIKVVLWVQTDSKYCIIDMLACVGQEGDVVNDQSFMLKIDLQTIWWMLAGIPGPNISCNEFGFKLLGSNVSAARGTN